MEEPIKKVIISSLKYYLLLCINFVCCLYMSNSSRYIEFNWYKLEEKFNILIISIRMNPTIKANVYWVIMVK
jgi:hypothetical protein